MIVYKQEKRGERRWGKRDGRGLVRICNPHVATFCWLNGGPNDLVYVLTRDPHKIVHS